MERKYEIFLADTFVQVRKEDGSVIYHAGMYSGSVTREKGIAFIERDQRQRIVSMTQDGGVISVTTEGPDPDPETKPEDTGR